MAINYKWTIVQMNAHIQADGQDNVIYTVHWNYSENTEAFEAVVIGWLENALDMDAIKAGIDADIQSQVTPVNEDLYFTWQEA